MFDRLMTFGRRSAAPGSVAPGTPASVAAAPDQQLQQRDLVTRTFQIRAESANDQQRSVDATVFTDRPVAVFDMRSFEIIDEVLRADGVELPARMPMLDNHNHYDLDDVLGSARNSRIEGDGGVATLFFARLDGDDEQSRRVERAWSKVRDGHITDVSLGYRVVESVTIPAGQTQIIKGRSYTAGSQRALRVVTRAVGREVSLTPIGADSAAKIRNQSGPPTPRQLTENPAMNEKLRKYLESIGLRSDATEQQAQSFYAALGGQQRSHADLLNAGVDVQSATTTGSTANPGAPGAPGGGAGANAGGVNAPAAPATAAAAAQGDQGQRQAPAPASGVATAEPPNPAAADPDGQQRTDPAQAEFERQREIRQLGSEGEVDPALITRACDERWSVARASREFLVSRRISRGQAPAVHTSAATAPNVSRAMAAALMRRHSDDVVQHATFRDDHGDRITGQQLEQVIERAGNDADRFADMSMLDMCRAALQIENRRVPHNREEMIRAAASTATLSYAFSTDINAQVVDAYNAEIQADTTAWCEEGEVSNFQQQTDVSRKQSSGLKRLPRGSQAEHTTFSDEGETYRAYRYAEQWLADEQDFIDDRFNMFTEIPREFAIDAAQVRPDLVYSLLLANGTLVDTGALFNATAVTTTGGHANLTTAVLGSAGLKAAITAMRNQKWGDRNLNLAPRHLLVPPDLDFTADELINSAQILVAGNTDTERGNRNTLAGRNLQSIPEARLGVNGVVDPITGTTYTGSATNWFLAAQRRTVKVVYLRGSGRAPTIRQYMLDQGRWGMGWDMKLDVGAFSRDFRGMHKSTGAG